MNGGKIRITVISQFNFIRVRAAQKKKEASRAPILNPVVVIPSGAVDSLRFHFSVGTKLD